MATAPIRTKRWTRLEYERLVGLGAFGPGDRIELVGGDLHVLPPQGSPHMTAIGLAEDVLRAAFGGAWHIRTQGPIALDNESEPEPDVAVVSGSRRHYSASHPTQPVLLGSTRPTARRRRRLRLAVYGDPAPLVERHRGSPGSARGPHRRRRLAPIARLGRVSTSMTLRTPR